jgi:hypothetical protein
MKDEHDDDMNAEVHEAVRGEADQYVEVAEDVDARAAEAERERLREMQHNLEKAEGDELEDG